MLFDLNAEERERQAPDLAQARSQYALLAHRYDRATRIVEPVRRQAVARLELVEGQTVIDVGCGTGANLARLLDRIGSTGRVVGIDPSPSMLDQARARARADGWTNIELLRRPAAEAALTAPADAALFSFTHDVLRVPAALDNVLRQVRPGGRVVAAGPKWASGWGAHLNALTWATSRRYVTTFEGFWAPWDLLAERVEHLQLETMLFGAAFVARGTVRAPP